MNDRYRRRADFGRARSLHVNLCLSLPPLPSLIHPSHTHSLSLSLGGNPITMRHPARCIAGCLREGKGRAAHPGKERERKGERERERERQRETERQRGRMGGKGASAWPGIDVPSCARNYSPGPAVRTRLYLIG